MELKMTYEQMQNILDNAPESAKYVRKTKWMTHYSEGYFVGSTSIEKLRVKLNKHKMIGIEYTDTQQDTITLEK